MQVFQHLIHFFKNRQARAIAAPFFLFGLLYGTWATMIPFVKEKFALDDRQLGLLLLCLPMGALFYNPTAARLIQRFGMERITIASMFVLIILSITWLMVPWLLMLVLVLLATGMGNTQLNIAMNLCASHIENVTRANIMATCHGMFSLGLMSGALFTSTSVGMGLSPVDHMLVNAVIGVILSILVVRTIHGLKADDIGKSEEKFKLRFPKGALAVMVGISLCTNLTEGSMIDWASVYMKEIVKAPTIYIGWGLASFSILMATGRFFGDYFIPKWGNNSVLFFGGLVVALGLSVVILFPTTPMAILGFALGGGGISCAAPILYSAAAKNKDVPQGLGLAILNSFSIFGFLVGPVVIGFISEATSLKFSFALVVALALVWMYLTSKVKL
ncbi:MAG: MFS transporter [Saprospiraceae bacterium]|nr:MFS transporter [Saprospiraceae bacterium]